MANKGVLNDYIQEIHSEVSLCSVPACSLQPTAALIHNNKWYHSALFLPAPCNLLQLSHTTNGITRLCSCLLPATYCSSHTEQQMLSQNSLCTVASTYTSHEFSLSTFIFTLANVSPSPKWLLIVKVSATNTLWTNELANCKETGDRVAKKLEGADPWDIFLIPQYNSLSCSAYLKKVTVAKLVKTHYFLQNKTTKMWNTIYRHYQHNLLQQDSEHIRLHVVYTDALLLSKWTKTHGLKHRTARCQNQLMGFEYLQN
jgi:hypothetical protein